MSCTVSTCALFHITSQSYEGLQSAPFFRGEAEALRVKAVPLKSHSSQWQRWDPSPGPLFSKVQSPHKETEAKREVAFGSPPHLIFGPIDAMVRNS